MLKSKKIWYGRTPAQNNFPAFKTYWANQVRIKKITTKMAGQMGFGMNAMEETVDNEYNNTCNNMAQAHSAQPAVMSNMSNNSTQMDDMQQQINSMQQMFQNPWI